MPLAGLYDSQTWLFYTHCYIPGTQNSAWHTVGAQSELVKCIKHSYFLYLSVEITLTLQAGAWELSGLSIEELLIFVTGFSPLLGSTSICPEQGFRICLS